MYSASWTSLGLISLPLIEILSWLRKIGNKLAGSLIRKLGGGPVNNRIQDQVDPKRGFFPGLGLGVVSGLELGAFTFGGRVSLSFVVPPSCSESKLVNKKSVSDQFKYLNNAWPFVQLRVPFFE